MMQAGAEGEADMWCRGNKGSARPVDMAAFKDVLS